MSDGSGRGWFRRWWFPHSYRCALGCLWPGGWPELGPLLAESRSCPGNPALAPRSGYLPATSADSTKMKRHMRETDAVSFKTLNWKQDIELSGAGCVRDLVASTGEDADCNQLDTTPLIVLMVGSFVFIQVKHLQIFSLLFWNRSGTPRYVGKPNIITSFRHSHKLANFTRTCLDDGPVWRPANKDQGFHGWKPQIRLSMTRNSHQN